MKLAGRGSESLNSIVYLSRAWISLTAVNRVLRGMLTPAGGYRLEWPRYVNGTPLPARPDGSPDFTGVVGY